MTYTPQSKFTNRKPPILSFATIFERIDRFKTTLDAGATAICDEDGAIGGLFLKTSAAADKKGQVTILASEEVIDNLMNYNFSLGFLGKGNIADNTLTGTTYIGTDHVGPTAGSPPTWDFTKRHIGFKWIFAASKTGQIWATNGDGADEKATNTGITTAVDAPHLFSIIYDKSLQTLFYFIDGVLVATHTDHIPTFNQSYFITIASATETAVDAQVIISSLAFTAYI